MPVFKDFIEENYRVIIWEYQEEEDLFSLLNPNIKNEIKNLHPKRQKEILMVRNLLRITLPQHNLYYKPDGKPYLEPSGTFISISHSFPLVAIAISKEKIGIDLEKIQPKLLKIKKKFLHSSEIDWAEKDLDLLTAIWTIKESLYKLHTPNFWSFREHYEVDKWESPKKIKCRVFEANKTTEYQASIKKINSEFYIGIVTS